MTFEEEFPSLKGLTKAVQNPTDKIIHLNMVSAANGAILLVDDVQKHCLDKERVRKVLNAAFIEEIHPEDIIKPLFNPDPSPYVTVLLKEKFMESIKKALGL